MNLALRHALLYGGCELRQIADPQRRGIEPQSGKNTGAIQPVFIWNRCW